jgi:hypothetical protein
MADVEKTKADVEVNVLGEEALRNLGLVGAEAFAHIAAAAATGDFTGAVTYAFGKMSGAITEAAQHIISFVEEQARLIETLDNLATATGTTIPEILGLREAFASVGIATASFERSFGRLAITIGSEWASIQQSVRTAVNEQTAAMQHVEQSSLNVSKAYRNLGNVLRDESVNAQKDAEGIHSAAISLAQAEKALRETSADAARNSQSLESAQLSLARARNQLAKDKGEALPYDEKTLKLQEDQLAVTQAQQRVYDANEKKKSEALDKEMKELAVQKARTEQEAAINKQIADQAAGIDKIRQAQLDIQKAVVARAEAEEKAHEVQLKNIPAIAKEVEQVIQHHKKWDDVMNHAELSATNLSKAVILAASGGGQPPKAIEVFTEMSKLFQNMGDSGDAMNKKMEIVQKTMGAGFSAGRASAAQLLAVLQKGPEELQKFSTQMNTFAKSLGLDELGKSTKRVEEFNSANAQLSTTLDIVRARFGAILSVPMASFFNTIRESIMTTGGNLNKLTTSFASFLEGMGSLLESVGTAVAKIAGPAFTILLSLISKALEIMGDLASAVAKVIKAITDLMGVKWEAFDTGTTAVLFMAAAFTKLGQGIALVMGRMTAWIVIIGLVTTAVGLLVQGWSKLPGFLGGGKDTKDIGDKIEAIGQSITRTAAKLAGFDDKQLDEANKKVPGFLGDSKEIDKTLGLSAEKTESAAGKTESSAAKLADAGGGLSKAADKLGSAADKLADPKKAGATDDKKTLPPLVADKIDEVDRKLDKVIEKPQSNEDADYWKKHGGDFSKEPPPRQPEEMAATRKNEEAASKWITAAEALGKAVFHGTPDSGLYGKLPLGMERVTEDKEKTILSQDAVRKIEEAANKDAATAEKNAEAARKSDTPESGAGLDESAGKLDSAADKASGAADKQSESAEKLGGAAEALGSAAQAIQQLGASSGEGKAAGGRISGPGGPRDDKAGLYALSNGEYVMQTAAVEHYGPQLFDALNSLAVGGFAVGGPVGGARAPSITSGPSSGPASVLNLTIDGQHFNGLQAPEHVATKLKTYAVGRQSSSAGRMPTWMR